MQERQLDALELSRRMDDKPVIVLFRNDLRVRDNGALSEAARSAKQVLPVLLLDDGSDGARPAGGASNWWLHHSIKALTKALDGLGAPLMLRSGAALPIVSELVEKSGADTVLWNRRYEPGATVVDAKMKEVLRTQGLRAESFDGHLLHEPSRLKTGSGTFYKVFKPFWNALSSGPEPRDPIDAPKSLRGYSGELPTERLDDLLPLPSSPDWAAGLRNTWTPGEDGALATLDEFISNGLDGYSQGRDFPGVHSTSSLSPHLSHGEITPFTIFAAIRKHSSKTRSADAVKFRQEVGWREFCYHLLFHNPDLHQRNFQAGFDSFPWLTDKTGLRAWQRGATGYPIVDAGMRELWLTGTMHNRVRMIAASFLTKHLLIDWREGERWFWDTLVDADPASNPGNWQWVAGTGADAAPYFRIFNPVLQGEKFDHSGAYVRKFVPELARLPDRFLHQPWEAPADAREEAGVVLGENYPSPIVKHAAARARALAAYQGTRGVL